MNVFRQWMARILGHKLLGLVAIVVLWFWAGAADRATVQLLSFLVLNVLLAQSINLLTGIAGQISLGHAGFFAIGAYAAGVLSKTYGVAVPVALVLAIAMTAAAGWLLAIPAGRVKEIYLAMMTTGFGLLCFEIAKEWSSVTGGVVGLSGIASPTLRNLKILGWTVDAVDLLRIMLVATAIVLLLMRNFVQSHHGRAFFAVQASEIAAGSIGIPRGTVKRRAYAISGAMAGLAGALYAHLVGYLGPDSFGIMRSVEVLVMAIVGGLGTIIGPILGAALFTWLPERLQVFAEYQFMVYGLILMVIFLVLRRGIAGALIEPTRFIAPRAMTVHRAIHAGAETKPASGTDATAGDPPALLDVHDLGRNFAGLVALDGVSLSLRPGRITALIGPNGSGKSTLVNVVSGIYPPSRGRVVLASEDVGGKADHAIARRGLVRTFQDPRLVPTFTVRENVLLGGQRHFRSTMLAAALRWPSSLREEADMVRRTETVLSLAGLQAVADQTIESLPYGYRRLVEVGRAILAEPTVVLLDEPAAGLSEAEQSQLAAMIRHLRDAGKAVLLIEHHMDFVNDIVDDVVVLDSGRVIYRGHMRGMREDPAVIAAYLGVGQDGHA
ncbi:ATP-binding cassette domain-containing protein [Reyranella sp. CPCC 100927]|uniref:branched-chain amino acid ABC transporter ATP-binding protein/permease n=1 Tax=Reyranella sp. CPCC 100927 TaxID=2599616 RepID=UPI0011B5D34F|nr:branched-chain amino acid ABC transporter ATP-binding protein/permease [Reyranella sp. CPCC 100927]TWT00746.1 branched-chain amino acid ABC transporter ATP-binding protein/permease [Reyranella sp. CPCC 100927]